MTDAEIKDLHYKASAAASKLYPILSPHWFDEYLLTVLALTQEKEPKPSRAVSAKRREVAKKAKK